MERMAMSIDGMSCGHCVAAVTKALKSVDGVRVEHLSVGSGVISYDPATIDPDQILRAVAAAGYHAASVPVPVPA